MDKFGVCPNTKWMLLLFPIQHVCRCRNRMYFIWNPLHFSALLPFPLSHTYLLFFFLLAPWFPSRRFLGYQRGLSQVVYWDKHHAVHFSLLCSSSKNSTRNYFTQRWIRPFSYQQSLQQLPPRNIFLNAVFWYLSHMSPISIDIAGSVYKAGWNFLLCRLWGYYNISGVSWTADTFLPESSGTSGVKFVFCLKTYLFSLPSPCVSDCWLFWIF